MYEQYFPGLQRGYRITSPLDPTYNCIGWAASATDWLEPDPNFDYKWPETVPREYTLAAYARVYELLGYTPCDSEELEAKVEKVAIFVNADGTPTHASRQLETGEWTSKLGRSNDISHALRDVEGNIYGTVAMLLKRQRVNF